MWTEESALCCERGYAKPRVWSLDIRRMDMNGWIWSDHKVRKTWEAARIMNGTTASALE